MIDWIARRFGYVKLDSIESTAVYYTGRLESQKAVIDSQAELLYNSRRR